MPGGHVVRDANGQALAYIHSRNNEAEALQAKVLTKDEARRIAINVARLRAVEEGGSRLNPRQPRHNPGATGSLRSPIGRGRSSRRCVSHFDDIGRRGAVRFPGASIFEDTGSLLSDPAAWIRCKVISMPSDTPPPVRMDPVSTTRASIARTPGCRWASRSSGRDSPSTISRLVVAGRPASSPAAHTIMPPCTPLRLCLRIGETFQ
jgi:hypothetical protein